MFWFTESYYNLSAKRSAILQGQALFIIVKQKILFHFWASDRQTGKKKDTQTDTTNIDRKYEGQIRQIDRIEKTNRKDSKEECIKE